jgi:uncharacterized membrane protein
MQRYPFLRFATSVLRIVGWIVLVVGVITSIVLGILTGSAANGIAGGLAGGIAGGIAGFFIAVLGIIFSFLGWVFLLTTRELLYLLTDVEENTRNTAERITKE